MKTGKKVCMVCVGVAMLLMPRGAWGFDPTNVTGCVMWLQAGEASVQTNMVNGRITQWNDLSGSGNHAVQADTNRQPLYVTNGPNGLPTIYFDVRNYSANYNARLLTSLALTNACTTYIVARVMDRNEQGISWRRLLGSRDKNWFLGAYTPGTFYAHGHSGELSGMNARLKAAYRFNRTYTMSALNTGSNQFFYVNGYDLTGDSSKNVSPGRLSIGSVDVYSDEGDVQISEVIAYNRALAADERQQVESYLATRYGITSEGFSGPVWSGNGVSNRWSDSANWAQSMPAEPMLAFSANRQTSSVNDLTGLTLDSVMIWDYTWQLSGNPVTLNNGFFCNSGADVLWGLDTALPAGEHTFSVRTGKRLTLSGLLSGAGVVSLGLGADYAGTLSLTCPTNTFTGAVLLKGGTAEVTALSNSGQSSSLGAASGSEAIVVLGNRRMNHSGGLRYIGTSAAATDRPFAFIRRASIENNSPSGAALTFNGAWAAADAPQASFAYLSLGGTSTGVNTINTSLANAPGGANALFVNVKGGLWRFTQPSTFTGNLTVDGGTVLANCTAANGLGAGRVVVMPGGTLGGTGVVTSSAAVLQYEGAIISPGDPSVNGGIGCLTYAIGAGLASVRLRCQVTTQTNDCVKFSVGAVVPAHMVIEVVAESDAACPDRVCILEASSLSGTSDLSDWEVEGPGNYRAVREGNSIVLYKGSARDLSAWQRFMPIRFKGYEGASVLTNFPALIKVSEGCGNNRFHYADCATGGADVLFTDAAGNTLNHEIELWNTNGESHIWVQIPTLTRNASITLYWKNPALEPKRNTFRPTDLPNCGLWLDAGQGITANGSGFVSEWADQSGKGRHATQTNTGMQPNWISNAVNGLPALRFEATGTKDGMVTGWSATNTPYTYFVAGAFRTNSGGFTWRRILQGSSGYNCGFAIQEQGKFFLFTANPGGYTTISTPDLRPCPGVPFVLGMRGDGTNTSARVNGFIFNTVAVHLGPNILGIGASGQSGDGWAGDVMEVIAYDRALSASEQQQVERYLALKYDALSAHAVPAAGLRQWLRADTVNADVLEGSAQRVSKCENQTDTAGGSVAMNALQSETNRMPEKVASAINGKPALRFDSVAGQFDGLKTYATPMGKAYSVITVYAVRTTNSMERVVVQGVSGLSRLSVTNGLISRRASGVVSQFLPCPTNTPMIATLICNEVASRFYVNGVNITQDGTPVAAWGMAGTGDSSMLYYGAGTTDGALDLPLDGDLAEVLVYDRVLSDAERLRIERYLAERYAIPVDTSNARVWSNGFSGVWHFTGTDRFLLADASPAQNGAVLMGSSSVLAEETFAGRGLQWGSATQLGQTRTAPTGRTQTFSFWAKQAASPASQAILLTGTNEPPYVALNNTSGKVKIATADAAAQVTPSVGVWTHYAVAVNPDNSVQVYGNGMPLATVPDALAANLPTNQVLTIGHAAAVADATKTFAGTLDEMRLETASRSADWIRAAYLTQAENERFTLYNHWGSLLIMR